MTNITALTLALLIISCILADMLFNDAQAMLFLGRKMFSLIEYLAIWR